MAQAFVVSEKGAFFEGKATEIIQREMSSAMYEATAFLESEVKEGTPQGVFGDQGGLLSTIHGEVIEKGETIVKGIVAHQSAYGDVVEKGRDPGKSWPPEGALLRWIEVQLDVGERAAKNLEFVIRRKIGQKGTKGAHMFENALKENWNRVAEIFDRHGFEIAKKING